MGAHETNKGLCEALVRAFVIAGCNKVDTQSNIATTHNHRNKTDLTADCAHILERLRARGCSLPSRG